MILDRLKLDFPNSYKAFDSVNIELLSELLNSNIAKLSTIDKRYIICFIADMNVHDIANMFNIDSTSVYTAKYRLKKKFPADKLPF